jgi:hypothetical protein
MNDDALDELPWKMSSLMSGVSAGSIVVNANVAEKSEKRTRRRAARLDACAIAAAAFAPSSATPHGTSPHSTTSSLPRSLQRMGHTAAGPPAGDAADADEATEPLSAIVVAGGVTRRGERASGRRDHCSDTA